MSGPVRQSNLFAAEDFLKVFQSFKDVNFTAYDFDTVRSALVEYIKEQFPEDFNDYIESSEFIAIIELLSFLSTSLALRTDLNSRENFLDTAERRESIIRLSRMLSYNPKRNIAAKGLFKITAVETNEPITDSNGINLKSTTVFWNDLNNPDSFEQFITILNAAFSPSNSFGKPNKSGKVNDIPTDLYQINSILPRPPVNSITLQVPAGSLPWEVVNADFTNNETFFERHPDPMNAMNLIYRNDGSGLDSDDTGFFVFLKQGTLINEDFRFDLPTKNRVLDIRGKGINQDDVYFQEINDEGEVVTKWTRVPALTGHNVVFNSLELDIRDIYNVITEFEDSIKLKFADGNFGNVPKGIYRSWYRESFGQSFSLRPENASNLNLRLSYTGNNGQEYALNIFYELRNTINNSVPTETDEQIKLNAPAVFFTQNRMVNSEDYNVFPLSRGNEVEKVRSINRTHAGHSRYIDINDPTGITQNVKLFGEDGAIYKDYEPERLEVDILSSTNLRNVISETLFEFLFNQRLNNFFYDTYYKDYLAGPNGSDLDFEALGYKWGTLPQKERSSTGFFYDTLHPDSIETWFYNGIHWQFETNFVSPEAGIPLRANVPLTVKAISGITDSDYFITNNEITFKDAYLGNETIDDTLEIEYRIAVNTNDGVNRHIAPGAVMTLTDTNIENQFKTVAVMSVVNSGIPRTSVITDIGPIEASTFIFDTWLLQTIIPKFRLEFTSSEIDAIEKEMRLETDFGIGYDVTTDTWYVIKPGEIDLGGSLDNNNFDLSTMATANDSSWLVFARYEHSSITGINSKYVFTTRGIKYVFESLREVRFFYSPEQKAIDITTGKQALDEIVLLDLNTKPIEVVIEVWKWILAFDDWEQDPFVNTTSIYNTSSGIPLVVTDPTEQIVTTNAGYPNMSNENIDDRGVLQVNHIAWAEGDAITIQYNLNSGKLDEPIFWNIHRSFILGDGHLDQTKIEIRPIDSNEDNVPNVPLSYDEFVLPTDIVYFERYTDFDNYQYFRPWKTGYNFVTPLPTIPVLDFENVEYDGLSIDETGLFIFDDTDNIFVFIGQVEEPDNYLAQGETVDNTTRTDREQRQYEYAKALEFKIILDKETGFFYDIPLITPPDPPAVPIIKANWSKFKFDTDHYLRNGRSFTLNTFEDPEDQDALWYEWRHFAPQDNRIDPSISNIIDMYILTSSYYDSISIWKNEGKTIAEFPAAPTSEDLRIQFGDFNQYKMLSDQIIFNPATFRVLFGMQAELEFRATFKVVKLPSTFVSDSEVKSQVIQSIDEYFNITNWDFGESFYYTELAAYIHQQLSTIISSVVIVPNKSESQFGDLFQIKSEPTELFLSTATVANVEIIESLTDTNMRVK